MTGILMRSCPKLLDVPEEQRSERDTGRRFDQRKKLSFECEFYFSNFVFEAAVKKA